MTPKTSRVIKVKGRPPASSKGKHPSAAKKATPTAAAKAKPKATPKPPKAPKLPKMAQIPGGPKPLNTLKQIKKQLLKNQIKHRAEMENEDAGEVPIKYADPTLNEGDFVMGSEAAMTWGGAATEGGHALRSARVGRGLTGSKRRMAAGVRFAKKKIKHAGALAPAFALDESDIDYPSDNDNDAEVEKVLAEKEEQERMKKFGSRSPFLELPREVRELVYGYLLIKDKPIEVHGNWSATYPLSGPASAHAILGVNRAINREASKFLAMTNTFHALVRRAMPDWKHNNKIDERYIVDFRNIIVETMDKNVLANAEERLTCQTLERLKKADSPIYSLILILEPYRIQNPPGQALLQDVDPNASAVAYADWFKKGTEIHRLLTCHGGLRCRELFIVVKMKASELGRQELRVVIYIDARRLPQNFVRCKVTAENKQRLIASAYAARAEVEQVADDLEWLMLLTTTGLSLDDIRVKIATYEADRIKKLSKDADVDLPRLRLLEMDEEIADLKWWSRELKAIKKAAKDKAMKDLAKEITRFNIGYVKDMGDLAAPVIPSHWLDDQSEQMEDIQRPANDASSKATTAATPSSSNPNVVNPATCTPPAAIAASAPATYTFIPCEYEPPVIATMRDRKERLTFRAANGELLYAPDVNAPVPSVAQAQPGTLAGVLRDLANPTTEKAALLSEVEKGKKSPISSMEAGGDWVPKEFGGVDENAGDAAADPFSSMQSGGDAIPKGFRIASPSFSTNVWRKTGEENIYAIPGEASAATPLTVKDSLFFTESSDAAMAHTQLREKVASDTSGTTPLRDEEGLFFTVEDDAEMAQSVQLKEVGIVEEAACGVGTTRDRTSAGLGSALNKDAGGRDGDIDEDGMDELEAEMNAAFEKELAGDGDDGGDVVEEVLPERNRNGWLR